MQSRILENRPLFKECVEALNITLLPDEESDLLTDIFENTYPISRWGKIDWSKIEQKIEIGCNPNNIILALEKLLKKSFDTTVYIEWSDGGLPAIKTDLLEVVKNFDEVKRVTFEKFIFNPYEGYIIEILPGDSMTVGVVSTINKDVA
jgi:hypothetical protein